MIVFVNLAKFAIAILLLPVVVAVTESFLGQIAGMKLIYKYFVLGAGSYVIMHLFVFTPQAAYRFLQKIFAETMRFSAFLSNNVPLLLPMCSVLILLVHYILLQFVNPRVLTHYSIFALGFTLAMHLIVTAQDLSDEDTTSFKPHYFCMMTVIYIVNLLAIAALLDLNFEKFSLAAFFKEGMERAKDIYQIIGHKLIGFKK